MLRRKYVTAISIDAHESAGSLLVLLPVSAISRCTTFRCIVIRASRTHSVEKTRFIHVIQVPRFAFRQRISNFCHYFICSQRREELSLPFNLNDLLIGQRRKNLPEQQLMAEKSDIVRLSAARHAHFLNLTAFDWQSLGPFLMNEITYSSINLGILGIQLLFMELQVVIFVFATNCVQYFQMFLTVLR